MGELVSGRTTRPGCPPKVGGDRGREVRYITSMRALVTAAALAVLASAAHAEQRSFYDRNGRFAGSSVERGNSTSVYDRSGRFDGSIIRNSNGTSSYYDGRGRFTGSSTGRR